MRILVIDVGGTNVKVMDAHHREAVKIPSGPSMTPQKMVSSVRGVTKDWDFSVISIGYPGPVINGKPVTDPHNLGKGWVGFDFSKAFGYPVHLVNDAAMQALGSYEGGRMLFLGLGTGLGTALILDGVLQPMEIAHMPYRKGRTYEDYIGKRGLERLGKKRWRAHVQKITEQLKTALEADYVVLGGGNSKLLKQLPKGARLGDNQNALLGGERLWTEQKNAGRAGKKPSRRLSRR
ncbi:MAG TPA: ROK family protein [Bryobacteraceae bacterium]|jgi:predicted NBD/HSP70 family sugar kinase|nr:ROK family protein [Bryobacteraceae bacterium]